MRTLEAIFTRRSVRDFKHDPVSDNDLNDLLRAAMQAPSAKNEQPWHFIVIDDPEILHAIPEFHPYSKMLMDAPLAILVCSDRKLETKRASWLQDCSAATQNILLAAHALGLGAVWLGI
ncbi:MAG: nitroreductase family protein, partial [Brevefilum sp.]|nr:nitroreductase family protein [Brevefilum sp.]